MKLWTGRRLSLLGLVVGVGVAVGGIAYASIPDSNGVIHGCYRKTTGELIVIDSGGKGCEEGWKPLNWSQTGPSGVTGPTGPTGVTGATGPTGPTGTLSSAYLDAYQSGLEVVAAGAPVLFNTFGALSGIIPGPGTFTVATTGVYQVTVDLQGVQSHITAQLSVNGVGVGPSVFLDCVTSTCTVTRLLIVNAGDIIRLVNSGATPASIDTGSGITIVRIA